MTFLSSLAEDHASTGGARLYTARLQAKRLKEESENAGTNDSEAPSDSAIP